DPGVAARLDSRQRGEERVDRLRCRCTGLPTSRSRRWLGPAFCCLGFERTDVLAALFHARNELLLLVRRHRLEPLEHTGVAIAAVAAAATEAAAPASKVAAGSDPARSIGAEPAASATAAVAAPPLAAVTGCRRARGWGARLATAWCRGDRGPGCRRRLAAHSG